jgi:hypothetical protein
MKKSISEIMFFEQNQKKKKDGIKVYLIKGTQFDVARILRRIADPAGRHGTTSRVDHLRVLLVPHLGKPMKKLGTEGYAYGKRRP